MKLIERLLIHYCDTVVVVSDSIADWYAREYGIARPIVVRNIPVRQEGPPPERSSILRERFGIPDDHLIFIYQGVLCQGRQVEQFLRVFTQAPRDRHVVFMGYGGLEGRVREVAARCPNVHFLPAVSQDEILRHTAGADVGLQGGENVCLSYYYSLPNKLFEYLLAGVPALANDWPEIRKVIEQDGCGWIVGADDASWFGIVTSLSREEIDRARAGALRARQRYSWQEEEQRLVAAYEKALNKT